MNDKMREIMEQKANLKHQLEQINSEITEEDLKTANNVEIAEYTKLTLEIQKQIMILEALEQSLNK